jgi:L-lactate dehydrogenase
MSYAYALVNQQTHVDELCLIDLDMDRVKGEVMDLNHSLHYSPSKINIKCGTYKDLSDADICVICAGANQKVGETRMDLIKKNSTIFKDIVTKVVNSGFDGIFLVATNPLDVMTYLTYKYSKFPAHKVIGSGTILDTARLRYLIAEKIKINPKNVHAYVIGEHGDSEFIPWSNANVAFKKITSFLKKDELDKIEEEVRNSAYEVIRRKGSTSYGIGACMVRITNAILEDKKIILPVSSYDKINDVCISTPTIVGSKGVSEKIDIPLSKEEKIKLDESINVIKAAVMKVLDK